MQGGFRNEKNLSWSHFSNYVYCVDGGQFTGGKSGFSEWVFFGGKLLWYTYTYCNYRKSHVNRII